MRPSGGWVVEVGGIDGAGWCGAERWVWWGGYHLGLGVEETPR